jgi:thioredoxin-related protein
MSIRFSGAALGAVLALSSPAWADDVQTPAPEAKAEAKWEADFDKAVEQAKKEKKDLLVDFTGSDWCGWCKRLHKEVFETPEFIAGAGKQYVFVALDFDPTGTAKTTNPNPARDNELNKTHKVQGYPTILLMTADGEVFGRTGYQPGGGAKYVEHLAKLRADGLPALTAAKAIVAELAAAKDDAKPAIYEKAAAALVALDPGAATAGMLAGPVKAGFDADAENKSGLRAKAAKALMKSGQADEDVIDAAAKLDPKNEAGLLEYAVLAKTEKVRDADAAKAVFGEIEALFAGGGVKEKFVRKQLAIRGMSFAVHPQVINDQAKAKEFALRVRECGYDEGEDRLKQYVDKLIDGAPKEAEKK